MPFKSTPMVLAAVTVGGTATGTISVADTSLFYPGARVWLNKPAVPSREYMIVSVPSSTTLTLREILPMDGGARYGYSDLSMWTVPTAINQEAGQVVDVELSNLEKLSRPV